MTRFLLTTFTFCLLCCCSSTNEDINPSTTQEIKGRAGLALYRARVPEAWIRRDPLPKEPLNDTTKAICEYIIDDASGLIRIAIHNFPTDTIEQRIPPPAQVVRWQRQFTSLSPNDYSIIPQAFNGYEGLLFKGSGQQKDKEAMVIGWSLLLAPEHYRMLSTQSDKFREMRSDVTIKATGPVASMSVHEDDIVQFARSFELIEEIPLRS